MQILQKANNIYPINPDLPIMHGHTKIELKNVRTGLKTVIEHDNTFQGSFVAKFLHESLDTPEKNIYAQNAGATAPWKAMAGGLLLFKNTITEGTGFMPAGNVMVGKGAVDVINSDVPTELGSYNSIESAATASSITNVWDFNTAQANGQIGCVCLTSQEGGIVGYGNTSGRVSASEYTANLGYKYKSIDTRIIGALGLMAENGKRYAFDYVASTGTLTIQEYKTCGIATGSVFAGLAKTYTHDLSGESAWMAYVTGNDLFANYCGNNIIRFLPANKTVASGEDLLYLEYDCSTHTPTVKTLTNQYAESLTASGTSYYNDWGGFTADGKFMFYKSSGTWAPIIANLSTGVIEFDGTSALTALSATHSAKGIVSIGAGLYIISISMNGSTKLAIIDMTNETIKPIDSNGLRNSGGGYYSHSAQSTSFVNGYYQMGQTTQIGQQSPIAQMPFYLATINNLESAVTKTAAQTMKVTYTLTEA